MLNTLAELFKESWLGGVLGTFGLLIIKRGGKRIDKLEVAAEVEKEARHALELKITRDFATNEDLKILKDDLISAMMANRKLLLDAINRNGERKK